MVPPTASMMGFPRSASLSSIVAAPSDGPALAEASTTGWDVAGELGADDWAGPADDPGPQLLQPTAKLVTVTRTVTSLAARR